MVGCCKEGAYIGNKREKELHWYILICWANLTRTFKTKYQPPPATSKSISLKKIFFFFLARLTSRPFSPLARCSSWVFSRFSTTCINFSTTQSQVEHHLGKIIQSQHQHHLRIMTSVSFIGSWNQFQGGQYDSRKINVREILDELIKKASHNSIASSWHISKHSAVGKCPSQVPGASFHSIDYLPGRNLDKTTLTQLATGNFLGYATDIAIYGISRSGKSFIACCLGTMACSHGKRTLF